MLRISVLYSSSQAKLIKLQDCLRAPGVQSLSADPEPEHFLVDLNLLFTHGFPGFSENIISCFSYSWVQNNQSSVS